MPLPKKARLRATCSESAPEGRRAARNPPRQTGSIYTASVEHAGGYCGKRAQDFLASRFLADTTTVCSPACVGGCHPGLGPLLEIRNRESLEKRIRGDDHLPRCAPRGIRFSPWCRRHRHPLLPRDCDCSCAAGEMREVQSARRDRQALTRQCGSVALGKARNHLAREIQLAS